MVPIVPGEQRAPTAKQAGAVAVHNEEANAPLLHGASVLLDALHPELLLLQVCRGCHDGAASRLATCQRFLNVGMCALHVVGQAGQEEEGARNGDGHLEVPLHVADLATSCWQPLELR